MPRKTLRHISPLLAVVVAILLLAACSTKKNTPSTRFWHSFNARYNTYYNGAVAYVDGSLEKEKGNVDNFTEMIPLYTVGNKKSREIGKGNFDRAIEKAQKAIHRHSITRRPVWDKRRRKTAKDIEWLNRREYNPFLWKAWMLMGRAQFYEGQFDEAASTFSYMSRIYRTQPAIYGRARAWLAKSMIENDWLYDAEDVIRNMQRDSIHWRAQKEWDYTLADYYLHTGDYAKAIPYVRKAIHHEMRSKQRARLWFLLGQLYKAAGDNQKAYKAFRRVLRQNPPYALQFNARIAMTEVMAAGRSKQMIGKLRRMAANDNNAEYQDQIYYAIGNIYLSQNDTLKAIEAYEKGNQKATRSGVEKGVLLLHLGDLYWETEKFSDANRCYREAIGLLDKDRKDYQQLSDRSLVLEKLVPHTEAVHLQDSLQALAKMPEAERNKAIDKLIDAYKKKLKEERRKQQEADAASQNQGLEDITNNQQQTNQQQQTTSNQSSQFYFYNPVAVQQGKATFEKQWGKRENADNWRRSNKTVVAQEEPEQELTPEQQDSIAALEQQQDSIAQQADSLQNDPLHREYYLKNIPFTDEQMAASNAILADGLYNAGVVFKDKMDNLTLSERYLRRLADNFATYEHMDDAWYHIYLLYARKGNMATADLYLDSLKTRYPDSQWTSLLTDPYYRENAVFGKHIEDSLYAATYQAFKDERYDEVARNLATSADRFPKGAHRDKFIFVDGLTQLNEGNPDSCLVDMNRVVSEYPQSELAEMAGMIVNGVKAGRRLRGGKFDIGNVWQRRTEVLADADSTEVKQFVNDRNVPFLFMYAYLPDSLNENRLLFELARYNFTSYLVRNFDIEIDDDGGLHRMKVAGFRSYDEALQYARALTGQRRLAELTQKARPIIISEKNFPLLGTAYSYDDYDEYYAKHFAPLKISTFQLLQEPAELGQEKEEEPTIEEVDQRMDEPQYLDNGLDIAPDNEGQTIVEEEQNGYTIDDEQPQAVDDGGYAIEEEHPTATDDEGYTIDDEAPVAVDDTSFDITDDAPEQPQQNDFDLEEEPQQPQKDIKPQPEILAPEPAKVPEVPAKEQPSASKPKPSTATEQPSTVTEQPAATTQPLSDDDVEFIFDDEDVPSAPATTTKKTTTPPPQYDLEDEYYDLDGF